MLSLAVKTRAEQAQPLLELVVVEPASTVNRRLGPGRTDARCWHKIKSAVTLIGGSAQSKATECLVLKLGVLTETLGTERLGKLGKALMFGSARQH